MAVAHDASSKSAVTSGTTDPSWTHTPSGTPRAAMVFALTQNSSTPAISGVTYNGVSMTLIGTGIDTDTEPGCVQCFFLDNVASGAVTVTATRNTTSGGIDTQCVCVTVTASSPTEAYAAGMVTYGGSSENTGSDTTGSGTAAYTEASVTDGSPGTNSMRYAGCYYGGSNPPTTGTNSTLLESEDLGLRGWAVFRETTAGQGARSVGSTDSSDDRAAVHIAIRESSSATLTGSSATSTWNAAGGSVAGTTTLSGSSAVANWTAPTGTVDYVAGLSGDSAVANWTVPTGTLDVSAATDLTGASATATWVADVGSTDYVTELTGASAVSNWSVPAGAGDYTTTLTGTNPNSGWTVPLGSLEFISDLSAASAVANWVVPTGTLETLGSTTLTGDSASASWVVPVGSLSYVISLTGASAVANWTVPVGSLSYDADLTGASAAANWLSDLNALELGLNVTGNSAVAGWNVPLGVLDFGVDLVGDSAVSSWVAAAGSIYAPGVQQEALYQLYNLVCRLNVKQEMDSGNVDADSADVGGTAVGFNKSFKDVNSITGTALGTTELKVIIDFTDVPNPTGFFVYVFDASGTRASATVYWKARGVI